MGFIAIKDVHLRLVKKGRILAHKTVSKGKDYWRSKVYLKTGKDSGSLYRLYEVENLHIVDKHKQHRKGRAYIIFIPTN